MVKETQELFFLYNRRHVVSIPSRGSGKGDKICLLARQSRVSIPSRGSGKGDDPIIGGPGYEVKFQSPLGEVVKETPVDDQFAGGPGCFNPLSGKW